MLEKHSNRCRVYFAADFLPQFGCEFAELAREIREKHEPESVRIGPQAFIFCWPKKRQTLILTSTKIAVETLGLSSWTESLAHHQSVIKSALSRLGVERLTRFGFKISSFIPLSMTHAEMCELMFGSFVVGKDRLEKVCGRPIDPLVQIEGEHDDISYTLIVTPMTPEQMTKNVRSSPNLDLFLADKYLDTGIRDFLERLQQSDAFHFDIDLYQRDVAAADLTEFLRSSLGKANQMAEACVRSLRAQPIEGD